MNRFHGEMSLLQQFDEMQYATGRVLYKSSNTLRMYQRNHNNKTQRY